MDPMNTGVWLIFSSCRDEAGERSTTGFRWTSVNARLRMRRSDKGVVKVASHSCNNDRVIGMLFFMLPHRIIRCLVALLPCCLSLLLSKI
jgi:hypothetical protein